MFITANTAQRPMFPIRSRLAVARDVAVLTVCIGIVVGFLIEIWSPSAPARNRAAPVERTATTLRG